MMNTDGDYGLWFLVLLNSAVFILFAFSFFKPKTTRDWRSFGIFSAFLVALFTEMYGFPLTIYLLSGWLQSNYPSVDWLSHDAGHIPEMLFGWKANPHFGPFHLLSFVFIGGGFFLLSVAWPVLFAAQREQQLANTGPYKHVRHPQYVAFLLILFGFLIQWPTILTVLMFPVIVVMYWRLSLAEEQDAVAEFGDAYHRYAAVTPRFIPDIKSLRASFSKYLTDKMRFLMMAQKRASQDQTRRDFLYIATGTVAIAATAAASWPLIHSMNPSADVLSVSTTEVDVTPMAPGQRITVKWRGQPVFIERRTPETIAELKDSFPANLKDPESDQQRTQNPEYLVVVGVCTHLGCIPLGQNENSDRGSWGGWFCPCHGSHYDQSGRIRKGPAPRNLKVPPYKIGEAKIIRIG